MVILKKIIHFLLLYSYFPVLKTYHRLNYYFTKKAPSKLIALASDRPLKTKEIHKMNAFYGHANILKKFAGIATGYPLKCMIEHGPIMTKSIPSSEENSILPYFLCANPRYAEYFNKNNSKGKKAITIGPIISYLKYPQSKQNTQDRILLFFPEHSTLHIKIEYNIKESIARLSPVIKDFDRVVVCLYWKDVLYGLYRDYIAAGFDCVTAGHMFDPKFLFRLVEIINSSTLVISGLSGTEVVYATLLGKPVWVRKQNFQMSYSREDIKKSHEELLTSKNEIIIKGPEIFSEPLDKPNQRQIDYINNFAGTRYLKTTDELLQIFTEAEEIYCHEQNIPFREIPLQ